MSFFDELKRRNVIRVGIAYVIVAWLVMQFADVVLNNIAAPGWVFQVIMLVLAIGFPVVLLFAWAFEMTPDGVKRESEIDRSQSITKTTARNLDRKIIVILILALGYFAWDKFSAPDQPTSIVAVEPAAIGKSIAVLPFVNMSADADNEYFSDGLSEELLNLLAKVDGLKVAARTSSFKFRNSEADIAEIGQKLNVATVLEGSVRKSGNQVRITAQLIKVDDGFHLWSETYDRDLDNIFQVQDEIAQAIVEALKLPLLGRDAQPVSASGTVNFAAYDLYLLGRHHDLLFTAEGYARAIGYYQQALEIDPDFARALSGLSEAYISLSDFGDLPQGEALKLAQPVAEKALSLNPGLPEVHSSIGNLLTTLGRQNEAEIHFLSALKINPNHVNALLQYRTVLNNQFRFFEAMTMVDRALALDPLSYSARRAQTAQFIELRQFEKATNMIHDLIAANPDDPSAYELWGDLYREQGLPNRAIPMYRNAHRLRPADIYMASWATVLSLQLDDADLASYWLEQARSRGTDGQWTRTAENTLLYANGQYTELLYQVDHLLEQQPDKVVFLRYRSDVLMNMDQFESAKETLQLALDSSGYENGESLSGDQLITAVQLANVHDQTGDTGQRDLLLTQITMLLEKLRKTEPPHETVLLVSACVASIQNDLPGVLRELGAAVELGFRDHWELLRNPVFKRWQENPDFIAFHQSMLKAAASMRREYKINNPVALSQVMTKDSGE